jgi:hypothetical protein
MLVAWARDVGGNLFSLCRSTPFKLTSQESVSKLFFLMIRRPPRSTPEQTSLQNIRLFS